jgi:ankyrin repeat protein
MNPKEELIQAVEQADTERCARLLREGADVNTGLFLAVWERKAAMVEFFLANGAAADGKILELTMSDWEEGSSESVINILLAKGAKLSDRGDHVWENRLRNAAGSNAIHLIELLLSKGVDVNSKNERGDSALHCAALVGNIEVVKKLLANGADINARNNFGRIALFGVSDRETADLLIAKGIDVNVKDQAGDTAETQMRWVKSMREEDRRQHEVTLARIKAGNA